MYLQVFLFLITDTTSSRQAQSINYLLNKWTSTCQTQETQDWNLFYPTTTLKFWAGQFLKISSTHLQWTFEPQRLAKTKGSGHKWWGYKLLMFTGYKLNITEFLISFRAQGNQTQNCNFQVANKQLPKSAFLLHCLAPSIRIHTTGVNLQSDRI